MLLRPRTTHVLAHMYHIGIHHILIDLRRCERLIYTPTDHNYKRIYVCRLAKPKHPNESRSRDFYYPNRKGMPVAICSAPLERLTVKEQRFLRVPGQKCESLGCNRRG
jgi:hypothetical protein